MTDIFISYAREDRELARPIARALQARGWSVWWDRDVKPGQVFDEVIERELETAKSVVVRWSTASIASDWVKGEAAAAVQRDVFVPALIDNIKLPLEFRRRQTVDLIDWDGDTSHAGFRALCDGIARTADIASGSTPEGVKNREAAPDSWNQERVLKAWWLRVPALVMAAAAVVVTLVAVRAVLNQDRIPTSQLGPSTQSPSVPLGEPTSTAPTVAASSDRDKPTQLTSNEISGLGLGARTSYYYVFNAGPGTIRVTVDGKNKWASLANAVSMELFDIDAKSLLSITLGNTQDDTRQVGQVQLGRQQQIIMRVMLDEATIDYRVRLEGALDFNGTRAPNK